MAYPTAPGVVSYSGTYIPEIWSGKLLTKFYKATVFGAIANTDYEGDIAEQGDVVHINSTPDITISDHVKGQKLSHQQPESVVVDLNIDQGKSWSFIDNTITRKQSMLNYVEDWTRDASEQMKISIDSDILGSVYADVAAANKGDSAGVESGSIDLGKSASPITLAKADVLDKIVDMGTVLDEQNVPESGRWVVFPPWACALIKKSDLQDASLAGDGTSILRNGRVGMIDRFEIYNSNQLSKTLDTNWITNIIFGHKSAITFASQLIENEGPLKHPDFFGDYYRGLQVYGFEVIKPEAIGHLYAKS